MKPLIVIAGATATGKSDLALDLAKKLDMQIISAHQNLSFRTYFLFPQTKFFHEQRADPAKKIYFQTQLTNKYQISIQ